jgi:hypothetical protein
MLVRDCRRRGDRVERSRVQVPGLQADDDRASSCSKRLGQRVGQDPAPRVSGHDLGCAQPQVAQHEINRVMTLCADQDPHPRCAGEPEPVEVPTDVGQHLLAARRDPGEVGHRGTGREPDIGTRGQTEQVE